MLITVRRIKNMMASKIQHNGMGMGINALENKNIMEWEPNVGNRYNGKQKCGGMAMGIKI